jgi:hypothetical protein
MTELRYNDSVSPAMGDAEGIDHIMDLGLGRRSGLLFQNHPSVFQIVSRATQTINARRAVRAGGTDATWANLEEKHNLHLTMDGEKRGLPSVVLEPLYSWSFPAEVQAFLAEVTEFESEARVVE